MSVCFRSVLVAALLALPTLALTVPAETAIYYSQTFDTPSGWELAAPWIADSSCWSSWVLAYRAPERCDMANWGVPANATSPEISLSGSQRPELHFDHYSDYSGVGSGQDVCIPEDCPPSGPTDPGLVVYVLVRRVGEEWVRLPWTRFDCFSTGWAHCTLDLTEFADATIQVRFYAYGHSRETWDWSGVYIDNVQIRELVTTVRANAGLDWSWSDGDNDGMADVTLDGASSSATLGIASYVWRLGGNIIATTQRATVPLPVGSHDITLTITDTEGASHTDTVRHTVVANRAPTAYAGADQTARTMGSSATISLSASATDADGRVMSFAWYEGATLLGDARTLNVTLPLGNHTLRVEATDNGGAMGSDTVEARIVTNLPPVPAATISCFGRQCRLDAAPTTDPDGPLASYRWTAAGQDTTGRVRHQNYSDYDTYLASLAVTDDLGATAMAWFEVDASPEAEPPTPLVAPLLVEVRDHVQNDGDLIGLEQDAEAAWFAATDATLHVGIEARGTRGRPLVAVEHAVRFHPSWTADWGVGGDVDALEVVAHLQESAAPTYSLRAVLDSGATETLALLHGETSAATGIHWIPVPRLLLREKPGAVLLQPTLSVIDRLPGGLDLRIDTTGVGADYPLPILGSSRVDHTFDEGDESFEAIIDGGFSQISRDAATRRVTIRAARDDPSDTLFAQGLPVTLAPETPSFVATARFQTLELGVSQRYWPMILLPEGVTDVVASPTLFGCEAESTGIVRTLIRVPGINDTPGVPVPPTSAMTCRVSWDALSRTVSVEILASSGQILHADSAVLASAFRADIVAAGVDGADASVTDELAAWVDDIVVTWTR